MSEQEDKRTWRERHDEAHELLMRRLEQGGPEYAMKLARDAGILDEKGELTEPLQAASSRGRGGRRARGLLAGSLGGREATAPQCAASVSPSHSSIHPLIRVDLRRSPA